MRPGLGAPGLAVILLAGMTALLGACGSPSGVASRTASGAGTPASAAHVDIQLSNNAFEVVGWQPTAGPAGPRHDWSAVFAIYAGQGDVPPLLGRYDIESGRLVFRPRFPLTAGLAYRAVLQLPKARPIQRVFEETAADRIPSARVLHIYPSSDVLPSNELRLYVEFSAPMSRGEAAAYLHVLDAEGHVLPDVFLPAEELWDPTYEWLTMTFDPGRIKRGLTSNEKLGPPIAPGRSYTLVIDSAWQDAHGEPLMSGYNKSFVGGPALRVPPDPAQWHLSAPRAGTTGQLTLDFPTPMNFPLLKRMLSVFVAGRSIAGTVSIENQERRWRFTPAQPWMRGAYQLVVDRGIEDVAGNKIGQPFDIDVFERVTQQIVTRTVSLPFTVR